MNYQRQIGIFNPSHYQTPITIIGVGAVGSFVALALAKMGIKEIEVYDGDIVSEHNLPNQFYRLDDIGKPKVSALGGIIKEFSGIDIKTHNQNYAGEPLKGMVLMAVDSMDIRRAIWLHIRRQPLIEFMIDIRMGGEVAWLFAIKPGLDREFYENNLYPSKDAFQAPCSARSIIYTVLGTGCYASSIVRKYLAGEPYPKEMVLDFKLGLIL